MDLTLLSVIRKKFGRGVARYSGVGGREARTGRAPRASRTQRDTKLALS